MTTKLEPSDFDSLEDLARYRRDVHRLSEEMRSNFDGGEPFFDETDQRMTRAQFEAFIERIHRSLEQDLKKVRAAIKARSKGC